ncbi:MAG: EAL domain-containing protein, partial [Arcobacteraceae bacterium]
KFPIDVLKIDKSFIDDLPNDKDSIAIVKTILAMAKALGYKTIAEGVENAEQLDFLRLLECDLYQGYLKSQPINKHDFKKMIKAESV